MAILSLGLVLLNGLAALLVVWLDYRTYKNNKQKEQTFRRYQGIAAGFIILFTLGSLVVTWRDSRERDKIAAEVGETLGNLMGEGTIPYLYPQDHGSGPAVPLILYAKGQHLLIGVTVAIFNSRAFPLGDGKAILGASRVDFLTLRPGPQGGRPLPESAWISPNPGDAGTDSYTAQIWTQSGFYWEEMDFRKRRDNSGLSWAFRFSVTQHNPWGPEGTGDAPRVVKSESWSDGSTD